MSQCQAEHPEQPGVRCVEQAAINHEFHFRMRPEYVQWENPDFVRPEPKKTKAERKAENDEARQAMLNVARETSESNSKIALDRVRPDISTRKGQVLEYLQRHSGVWVDGYEISNERVGGSEGLRRCRELQEEGWPIEKRPNPNPDLTTWQYRYNENLRGSTV